MLISMTFLNTFSIPERSIHFSSSTLFSGSSSISRISTIISNASSSGRYKHPTPFCLIPNTILKSVYHILACSMVYEQSFPRQLRYFFYFQNNFSFRKNNAAELIFEKIKQSNKLLFLLIHDMMDDGDKDEKSNSNWIS